MRELDAVIFDLDGTLIDPWEGVYSSLRAVFTAHALQLPEPAELKWIVGPPIKESLLKLLGQQQREKDLESVHLGFRAEYDTRGLTKYRVYEGILPLLEALYASPYRLFIASSKPQPGPDRVIADIAPGGRFEGVFGAVPSSGVLTKEDVLKALFQGRDLDPRRAVMIGDRYHDLRAARIANMPSVGVLWGYGPLEELKAESPTHLVATPGELGDWLFRA